MFTLAWWIQLWHVLWYYHGFWMGPWYSLKYSVDLQCEYGIVMHLCLGVFVCVDRLIIRDQRSRARLIDHHGLWCDWRRTQRHAHHQTAHAWQRSGQHHREGAFTKNSKMVDCWAHAACTFILINDIQYNLTKSVNLSYLVFSRLLWGVALYLHKLGVCHVTSDSNQSRNGNLIKLMQ